MSKTTAAVALFSIWIISLFAIVSICKVIGIQLPLIAGVSSWDWLKAIFLVVELGSLLFE